MQYQKLCDIDENLIFDLQRSGLGWQKSSINCLAIYIMNSQLYSRQKTAIILELSILLFQGLKVKGFVGGSTFNTHALLQSKLLFILIQHLIINSMKSQQKQSPAVSFLCPEHKQKSTFVCLHKTCSNAFKIGCPKCRKDHAQHPNRLIPVVDFHSMLSKPIKYLENSTAFKLMNLKKKIEHIRNFRTSILQKQLLLIESNKNIKSTISSILDQHYHIRDVVTRINTETLTKNSKEYFQYLLKSKEFLAFNPVKADLVFNNEVIKTSRVALEKHLKTSHQLTDSIRQFLVKIIEVLLANCAYEQDDEQIELDQEGDNATNFNIFIKNRIDVTENPNIKSKLENEDFLQMFDQEKDALNQEIDILQRELDVKVGILNKIRSSNGTVRQSRDSQQPLRSSSVSQFKIQSKVSELKLCSSETEAINSKHTIQSLAECQILNTKLNQLRAEHQSILNQKQQLFEKLKESSNEMQVKCLALEEIIEKQSILNHQLKIELHNQKKMSSKLNQHIQRQQMQFMELSCQNKNLLQQVESQKKENAQICKGYERKLAEQKKSFASELAQMKKQRTLFQTQQTKLTQDLEKREKQIAKQKKRIQELQKIIEKMKESNAHIEKQLTRIKDQFQVKQKKLKNQIQMGNKDIERLNYKSKTDHQKIKHLQLLNKELNKELDVKNSQLRQKEKDLKAKDEAYKDKSQTASLRIKFLQNQLKSIQNSEPTLKSYESEQKKFKQMKQMLQISIKKNQQFKDKIFNLESQLQDLKQEKDLEKINKSSSKINIRQTVGSEVVFTPKKIGIEKSEIIQYNKSEDKISQIDSAKKKDKMVLKDKKLIANKEDRKLAYLQIKNIFKVVTQDMNLLEQRLKENNVIEKVYLKELQRKRVENKTLKKELQSVKLYGSNLKHSNGCRATSPVSKAVERQKSQAKMQTITLNSSITKTESLTGLAIKPVSSIK